MIKDDDDAKKNMRKLLNMISNLERIVKHQQKEIIAIKSELRDTINRQNRS